MKSFIAALFFLSFIASVPAQNNPSGPAGNEEYKLQDGHSLRIMEDGRIMYDGMLFDKYEDQTLATDKYLPYIRTIRDQQGNRESVYAALEMHEAKVNGKVWFVIYESAQGGRKQSYFTISSTGQARLESPADR